MAATAEEYADAVAEGLSKPPDSMFQYRTNGEHIALFVAVHSLGGSFGLLVDRVVVVFCVCAARQAARRFSQENFMVRHVFSL